MSKSETAYRMGLLEEFRPQVDKVCYICGAKDNLTIHHIRPMNCGGMDVLENLSLLCRPCHDKVHINNRPGMGYFWKKCNGRIRKIIKDEINKEICI